MAKFGKVAAQILAVLQKHPEGLDIEQIREILEPSGVQQHLDRRLRDLDPYYVIERIRKGKKCVYRLVAPRAEGAWDFVDISKKLRAKVLLKASGRCQLCGRTVAKDGVRLHIDHKIPKAWGGKTTEENLWAICSTCNEGKKNFYKTLDAGLMKEILRHKSVHRRIAELLRTKKGNWIDCDLIEFVANVSQYQTDWRKRLRELRYLGLEIETKREAVGRRHVSFYRLRKDAALPADPTKAARKYEAERAKKRKIRPIKAKDSQGGKQDKN